MGTLHPIGGKFVKFERRDGFGAVGLNLMLTPLEVSFIAGAFVIFAHMTIPCIILHKYISK